MLIEQIIAQDNELMDAGLLDDQIIHDFETYVADRYRYQTEHLDKRVKGVSHHYDEWSEANRGKIVYANRILECVRNQRMHDNVAKWEAAVGQLSFKQMKEMMEQNGRVEGIVIFGVYECIIAEDGADFRSELSKQLTGSPLLKDIRYNFLGSSENWLYFGVSGDASDILALEDESM